MGDYIGALRFVVEVRRWKTGGGLDGRKREWEEPTDENSELVATIRAGRQRKENALISSTTGRKTEEAIDWTVRRSKINYNERRLFIYWGGKVFEIESLLPDENNRTRRIIRTREKVRLANGLF